MPSSLYLLGRIAEDAGYCYRQSSVVGRSVCLCVYGCYGREPSENDCTDRCAVGGADSSGGIY